jgi:hypothetical protein
VVVEVGRDGEGVDGRGQLVGVTGGQERAEVGRLHHAGPAAGDHEPAGAGQPPAQGRGQPVGDRAARLVVPAHHADDRGRPVPGQPAGGEVDQAVVDAVVVQPLGQCLPDVGQGATVAHEVFVDHGVVHAGEAAPGEAAGQGVGRVEAGRGRRVRRVGELGYHDRTPPYEVGGDLGGGEPAADEQGVGQVHCGQIGRLDVQVQSLHHEPGQAATGQMPVEFGPRLDLPGRRVARCDDRQRWRRSWHGDILPPQRNWAQPC